MTSEAQAIKENKLNLIKIKSICASKNTTEKVKSQSRPLPTRQPALQWVPALSTSIIRSCRTSSPSFPGWQETGEEVQAWPRSHRSARLLFPVLCWVRKRGACPASPQDRKRRRQCNMEKLYSENEGMLENQS